MPDVFMAGYGAIWTPPPGRALYDDQGGGIGYNLYDRFDLGTPASSTLYGTQATLQRTINSIHAIGGNAYVDLLWNHSGFRSNSTSGFAAQGGYPDFDQPQRSPTP